MAKTRAPSLRSVRCYHCGHPHEVAARATRVSCPRCGKGLLVEDVTIKSTEGWSHFKTCGRVTIMARGRLVASTIQAEGGVEVRGELDARSYRGGPVSLKKGAVWKGDCTAPTLRVEAGARIQNSRFDIKPDRALVELHLHGELTP